MADVINKQIAAWFAPLNSAGAISSVPPARALSDSLGKLVPADGTTTRNANHSNSSLFMTASVDIWLRSVHSLMISAALTDASPLWAVAVGYYSSHYTVRCLAHLMGYFQLFHKKKTVQLKKGPNGFLFEFSEKGKRDGEHKFYWKLVKESEPFKSSNIFTENLPDADDSDVRHRNHANYADNLFRYPEFHPLNEEALRNRLDYISKIQFDTPPLPRFDHFPDLDNVQLIAYHRIVYARRIIDQALGSTNGFWNFYRKPPFVRDYMNFQLVESKPLDALEAQLS